MLSGSLSPAVAGESDARHSYMTQTCHHSTAPIFKQTLKRKTKDVNDFCACMSKTAVSQLPQEKDHTYALAYHEVHIVAQKLKRYDQPVIEMAADYENRRAGYVADYDISADDLDQYLSRAFEDSAQCYEETPSAWSTGLRGAFK